MWNIILNYTNKFSVTQQKSDNPKLAKLPLKKNKCNVLGWPSQSPDFNPTEMLKKALKPAVLVRNIRKLTFFCTKEWAKFFQTDLQD